MIALYILAGIFVFIALILLIPVGVDLKFEDEFKFKIKLTGIKVFEPKDKPSKPIKKAPTKKDEKDSQFSITFKKLKDKKGFNGAIIEIFILLKYCLNHFGYLLKRMKFKKVCLNLSVVGSDAAQTAIQYGEICAVAYPVLSLFESKANVKYKKINIKSEFEKPKGEFTFSLSVRVQIIFLIISAFKIYKEYKNFVIRNEL